MTDIELLEMAARAAGFTSVDYAGVGYDGSSGLMLTDEIGRQTVTWSPLTDDGDALRLAVMLRLTVKIEDHEIEVFNWEECLVSAGMFNGDDYEAATRRAIVRAAAKIEVEK